MSIIAWLVCCKCKKTIEVGMRAYFDLVTREVTCMSCYGEKPHILTAEELEKLWETERI